MFMSDNDDLKKQLEAIQNQLTQMQKEIQEERISINEAHTALLKICRKDLFYSSLESKMSEWVLYSSIFLSALVGVVGNWFVSLWFQPRTVSVIYALSMSGGLLVGIVASLLAEMFLIYRRAKRGSNSLKERV